MANKRVMKLASRGKRFGAYCIDAIVPVFNMILMFVAIGIGMSGHGRRNIYDNGYGYGWGNDFGGGFGYGNGYGYGYGYGGRSAVAIAIIIGIITLLTIAYMAVQMVFFAKSKTMGKAALGLQVISAEDGKPIGFWKMILREWIVKRASAYVFYLGFIWILIDDKNRGWHDKILDTYVVDLKESGKLNSRRTEAAEAAANPELETSTVREMVPEEPMQAAVAPAIDETIDVMPAEDAPAEAIEVEEDKSAENAAAAIEQAIPAVEQVVKDAVKAAPKDASVSMAMKKDELLTAAKDAGAEATDKMTKAEIIEAIEKVTPKGIETITPENKDEENL